MIVMAVFSLADLYRIVDSTTVIELDFTALRKNRHEAIYHILSGKKATDENQALVPVFTISIDNEPNGKQAGLEKASTIFELPVEGGATRFLAFFDGSDTVPKVGPVRSIRPYFIEYAKRVVEMLIHAGGSPEALTYLKNSTPLFYDLDEIGSAGKYFWRDRENFPPHNLFTNSTLLQKAYDAAPQKRELIYKDISWEWEDDETSAEDGDAISEKIFIDFSTQNYEVEYKYDKISGIFIRYQGGQIHRPANGEPLIGNNIILVFVQVKIIYT